MKLAKSIRLTVAVMIFSVVAFSWYEAITYGSGPPAGNTGAPNESDCTSCHGGSFNSAGTALTLTNGNNLQYFPDSTYTITISYSQSGINEFGFQTTALAAKDGKMAGTFTITNSSRTQSTSQSVNGDTRYYVMHTSSGAAATSNAISWSFDWKAPSKNVGDVDFYVAINSTNNNNQSSGDAIYGKKITIKPSPLLPVASFTAVPDTLCQGDSVQFTGSATNSPTTYTWTLTGANPASAATQNVKVAYPNAGTFTATFFAKNTYGVSEEVSKKIVVNAKPGPTIIAAGPTSFCPGDSTLLIAPIGSTYKWSTGATTRNINVSQAGPYSVLVTNAQGCSRQSDTVNISLFAKNTISLSQTQGTNPSCLNQTLEFTATANYQSYIFLDNGAPHAQQASNVFQMMSMPGHNTIGVVGIDGNGCHTDTASINIFTATPIGMSLPYCDSITTSSIVFRWTSVQGAQGYEVSLEGINWTNPSSGPTGLYHKLEGLNFNQQVKLFVRVLDSLPCQKSDSVIATCKTLPCSEITYDLDADSAICMGSDAKVTFSNISAPGYAIREENGQFTKDTVFNYQGLNMDRVLKFYMMDSTKLNCPEDLVEVLVKVLPPPAISLDPISTFCEGDSIAYIATTGGVGNYIFYVNNALAQDSVLNTFSSNSLANGDTLKVVFAAAPLGCMSEASTILEINERPQAGFDYNINALTVSFSDTTSNVADRLWDFGDGDTSTLPSPVHTYATQGTYTVKLITTNAAGCTDSAEESITVISNGIVSSPIASAVSVRPNPFNNEVRISYEAARNGSLSILMYDDKGRIVMPAYEVQVREGTNDFIIPTDILALGVYYLNITNGTERHTERLIKMTGR